MPAAFSTRSSSASAASSASGFSLSCFTSSCADARPPRRTRARSSSSSSRRDRLRIGARATPGSPLPLPRARALHAPRRDSAGVRILGVSGAQDGAPRALVDSTRATRRADVAPRRRARARTGGWDWSRRLGCANCDPTGETEVSRLCVASGTVRDSAARSSARDAPRAHRRGDRNGSAARRTSAAALRARRSRPATRPRVAARCATSAPRSSQ
mgnify:CR=1 FL=1